MTRLRIDPVGPARLAVPGLRIPAPLITAGPAAPAINNLITAIARLFNRD